MSQRISTITSPPTGSGQSRFISLYYFLPLSLIGLLGLQINKSSTITPYLTNIHSPPSNEQASKVLVVDLTKSFPLTCLTVTDAISDNNPISRAELGLIKVDWASV